MLGRGGAGRSVLSRRLGARIGAPVVELDAVSRQEDLRPLTRAQWAARQREVLAGPRWVADAEDRLVRRSA